MPIYCFECEDCEHSFEEKALMCDLAALKPACPKCNSINVHRDFSAECVYSADAIKTVGSRADRNADKFSDDYKEMKAAEDKKLRSGSVTDKYKNLKKYEVD